MEKFRLLDVLGEAVPPKLVFQLAWARKEGSRLVLLVPSDFCVELVDSETVEMLRRILNVDQVEVEVDASIVQHAAVERKPEGVLVYGVSSLGPYRLEGYYVGRFNALAYRLVLAAAAGELETPAVCVYSAAGLGKSHLVHGVVRKALSEGKSAAFFTGSSFVETVLALFGAKAVSRLYYDLLNVDLIVFDDVQELACAPDSVLSVFFEVLNAALRRRTAFISTSDTAPHLLPFHPRITTRLPVGGAVEIVPPGFEDRVGLLKTIARRQQIEIPDSFAESAAAVLASSTVRTLEFAISMFGLYRTQMPDRNPEEVGAAVLDLIGQQLGRYSCEERLKAIKECVMFLLNVPPEAFASSKVPDHVLARRAAVYAAVMDGASFTQIARAMQLNPDTVHTVYRAAKRVIDADPDGELARLVRAVAERFDIPKARR